MTVPFFPVSSDDMAKYFPNGFLAGMKKMFRKAMVTAPLVMIPCGLGAFFLGKALLFEAFGGKGKTNETAVMIILGFFTVLLLFGFIYNLVMEIRLLAGFKRVGEYLEDKNEDDLLGLAVSHYLANKETLAGGDSHWARMLLKRSKPG